MKVLQLSPGQNFRIGDGVLVKLLRVRGDRVWLAIDAPGQAVAAPEKEYTAPAMTSHRPAHLKVWRPAAA